MRTMPGLVVSLVPLSRAAGSRPRRALQNEGEKTPWIVLDVGSES